MSWDHLQLVMLNQKKPDHSHHTARYSQILDRANIDFYIYIYILKTNTHHLS